MYCGHIMELLLSLHHATDAAFVTRYFFICYVHISRIITFSFCRLSHFRSLNQRCFQIAQFNLLFPGLLLNRRTSANIPLHGPIIKQPSRPIRSPQNYPSFNEIVSSRNYVFHYNFIWTQHRLEKCACQPVVGRETRFDIIHFENCISHRYTAILLAGIQQEHTCRLIRDRFAPTRTIDGDRR